MARYATWFKILFFFLFMVSCSSEDSDSQAQQNNNNYFPLVVSNNWNYKNTVSTSGQSDMVSQETLSISNSFESGANTAFEFENTNPLNSAPTTLAFSNGSVYKTNSSLVYNGTFSLGIPDFPDLSLEVQDGVIYNKNSTEDTVLFSFSRTLQESIEGLPVTISYTISSVTGNSFENLEINNQNFLDIISSKLIVNMRIVSDIGAEVDVLRPQDVVIVTNYFAKDVGLIKSEASTNFDFISFPSLPIEDVSFFTLQELQSYNVSIE